MKHILYLLLLFPLSLMGQPVIVMDERDTVYYSGSIEGVIDLDKVYVESAGVDTSLPYPSNLLASYSTRDGSYFIDTVSGDSANILIPEFIGDGTVNIFGNKTRTAEHILDGNNYTIYFRMKYISDPGATATKAILKLGGVAAAQRGIYVYFFYRRIRVGVYDGSSSVTGYAVYACDTIIANDKYTDIHIQVNGTAKTVVVAAYNEDGTLINTNSSGVRTGAATTIDASGLTFNTNDNYAAYKFDGAFSVVTNFKKYNSLITYANSKNDTTVTGLQIHYPQVLGCTDISGNGNHLTRSDGFNVKHQYYTDINTYLLNNGFDDYQYGISDSLAHIKIPYKFDGTKITFDPAVAGLWISGYRIVSEHPANLTKINTLYDCKIRFGNSFFNRKNETIWGDSARSVLTSYYSATDTMTWHISELNQRTIYEWANPGYKGRAYVNMSDNSIEKWDRKLLNDVFLYSTDKTLDSNLTILQYTDDDFAQAEDSAYDHWNYVKLGYLQSDSAMLTIRLDDGDSTALYNWKPMFDSLSVSGILGIHASEVGVEGGTYNYMQWNEVLTMYNAGWEVADHNNYEVDNDESANSDSIDYNMEQADSIFLSRGISSNVYIGNRYGSWNPSTAYFTHKLDKSCHLAWGTGGSVNGTNPKIIDKFQLCAMAVDLAGPYYLGDTDNSEEIAALKAQVDLCKSGKRWGITFGHVYGLKVSQAWKEVINYAKTQNVGIVNVSDALNECKYLSK